MISQTATAIDLFSDFAEDCETVCCFFDFHEIKDSPRKTQNPVTDLLVLGHEAQSALAKPSLHHKMLDYFFERGKSQIFPSIVLMYYTPTSD